MNSRKRILALVTDAYGSLGGIAEYNRNLLSALAKSNAVAEVVVVPRIGGAGKADILPEGLRLLPPRLGRISYSALAARTVLREQKFDAIYCGHILMAPLGALLARWLDKPLWLQLHGIEAWDRPSSLIRWGVEQSSLVTAVSRYTKRRFLHWAAIDPVRVRVLPNTVSERFGPGPKPTKLLHRYGFEGMQVLLTVGRISVADRYKGHDQVIAALALLHDEHPRLRYVVAGEGNDRPWLEQLAEQRGILNRVQFIGRVSDDDLPDLYRAADVFAMPSTNEGFGIVFLEAMKSGIPTIGGNRDGSMDPLGDGKYGHAVSCGDPAELAEAIRRALTNPLDGGVAVKKFAIANFERYCAELILDLFQDRLAPDDSVTRSAFTDVQPRNE